MAAIRKHSMRRWVQGGPMRGENHGKLLDARSSRPVAVATNEGGLGPAVDVHRVL